MRIWVIDQVIDRVSGGQTGADTRPARSIICTFEHTLMCRSYINDAGSIGIKSNGRETVCWQAGTGAGNATPMLSSTHAYIQSSIGRGIELFPGIIESKGMNAGWYRQTRIILHPVLAGIATAEYPILRITRVDILQIVGIHSKGTDILILQPACLPCTSGKNAHSGTTCRKQDKQRQ